MTKPDSESEDREMAARLEKLSGALENARQTAGADKARRDGAQASAEGTGRAMSLAFRVMSEFVAGVVVGCLLGWQLDEWLSTTPLFLIVFLALGTAAGFWNVYRLAMGSTGAKVPGSQNAGSQGPDSKDK